jgi:hypothetical protein
LMYYLVNVKAASAFCASLLLNRSGFSILVAVMQQIRSFPD